MNTLIKALVCRCALNVEVKSNGLTPGTVSEFTFASKLIPCWNASSLCSGILKSCPSSTRLYFVFPGISTPPPQTAAYSEKSTRKVVVVVVVFLRGKIIQGQKEGEKKKKANSKSGSVSACFPSRRSLPTRQARQREPSGGHYFGSAPLKSPSSPPFPKEEKHTKINWKCDRRTFTVSFPCVGGLRSWSGPAFCPGLSARTDCEGVIG